MSTIVIGVVAILLLGYILHEGAKIIEVNSRFIRQGCNYFLAGLIMAVALIWLASQL